MIEKLMGLFTAKRLFAAKKTTSAATREAIAVGQASVDRANAECAAREAAYRAQLIEYLSDRFCMDSDAVYSALRRSWAKYAERRQLVKERKFSRIEAYLRPVPDDSGWVLGCLKQQQIQVYFDFENEIFVWCRSTPLVVAVVRAIIDRATESLTTAKTQAAIISNVFK